MVTEKDIDQVEAWLRLSHKEKDNQCPFYCAQACRNDGERSPACEAIFPNLPLWDDGSPFECPCAKWGVDAVVFTASIFLQKRESSNDK